jgi:hypothetical protein
MLHGVVVASQLKFCECSHCCCLLIVQCCMFHISLVSSPSFQELERYFTRLPSSTERKDYMHTLAYKAHQNKLDNTKNHLLDTLWVLRSDKEEDNSVNLPSLLTDIGLVHIQHLEITKAKNPLQLSLNMYDDYGASDRRVSGNDVTWTKCFQRYVTLHICTLHKYLSYVCTYLWYHISWLHNLLFISRLHSLWDVHVCSMLAPWLYILSNATILDYIVILSFKYAIDKRNHSEFDVPPTCCTQS